MVFVERIRANYETIMLPTQFDRFLRKQVHDRRNVPDKPGYSEASKSQKPLYVAFIDLKATYDWTPRPMLFKVLKNRL